MFKIVFVSFIMGNHEMIILYIKEKEIVIETQLTDYKYTQWEYYNFNENIITTIDSKNNITKESIDVLMENGGRWKAFPPLLYDYLEEIVQKEFKEGKVYIKTKTQMSTHEYELVAFPFKSYPKNSKFLNLTFDENFPLVSYRRDLNHKNRETGYQKMESIEKISEFEFSKITSRFK
ncbi:MAG: hypothetical protein IPO92_16770 [Saprospiraceae bacterium]|nr:hypothetical protein [Saprospiraceae bacterium]